MVIPPTNVSRSGFCAYLPPVLLLLACSLTNHLHAVERGDDQPRVTVINGARPMLMVETPNIDKPTPALIGALRQQVSVAWKEAALSDAIAQIQYMTKLNIVLDPKLALAAPPITLEVADMRLDRVMEWLAVLSGGKQSLVGEVYWLGVEPYRGGGAKRVAFYEIGDLTMPTPDFPGPSLALGDNGAQFQAADLFGADAQERPADEVAEEIADMVRVALEDD